MEKIELIKLYQNQSKHSNYQVLSNRLSQIIGGDSIDVQSRHEVERLKYILQNVCVKNKNILDIGGNSGFFSFEMIDEGAKRVHYYEGNKSHAEFVRLSSKVLCVEENIEITDKYFSFNSMLSENFDITLLLNVLHHVGDDYGDKKITIENAKQTIVKQINNLAETSEILVLQLGFNWKGKVGLCLFENGTKKEMIDFIYEGTKNDWEIIKVGIAERDNNIIIYNDINNKNINRNESLGEFLNRPIFIMKSLKYKK